MTVRGHLWTEDRHLRYIDSHYLERVLRGLVLTGGVGSGHLWVEGHFLRYIDEKGWERRILGDYETLGWYLAYEERTVFRCNRWSYNSISPTPLENYEEAWGAEEADDDFHHVGVGQYFYPRQEDRYNVIQIMRGFAYWFDTSFLGDLAPEAILKEAFIRIPLYRRDDEDFDNDWTLLLRGGSDCNNLSYPIGLEVYPLFLTLGETFNSIYAGDVDTTNAYHFFAVPLSYINKTGNTMIYFANNKEIAGIPPTLNDEPSIERLTIDYWAYHYPRLIVRVRKPPVDNDSSKGHIWVEGDELHYIDESKYERCITAQGVASNSAFCNQLVFNAPY